MMIFTAIVESRSSKQAGGPPGESDILTLNPQRRQRILEVTGWSELIPGTLNLKVEENAVHSLLLFTPVICENGENVKYPDKFAHIPKRRVGYLYYKGIIIKGDRKAPVLIRRACNPIKTRLEAFSSERLRDTLQLTDGDSITFEVNE